ncbi:endonuclease domain-containing protein [Rhizobium puerariae]|uniref:Endonuclease domain-containing protein n=1 Tax=Rhizobium puerariae TaxID=1585791 RepID=A0ABV6AKQ9_9HYPH
MVPTEYTHGVKVCGYGRERPVAGYIVDFACPTHHLIVEVDGSQHGNDVDLRYDDNRTRRPQKDGWTVLRFWTDDVLKDVDNVCLHIVRTVEEAGS